MPPYKQEQELNDRIEKNQKALEEEQAKPDRAETAV